MIKMFCIALVAGLTMTGPSTAQEVKKPVPESLQRYLSNDTDRSIDMIAQKMLEVRADGIITNAHLETYHKSLIAQERAYTLLGMLALDLDFDGTLSPDELNIARAIPATRNTRDRIPRVQMELMIADADQDNNGALEFEELRQHVVERIVEPSGRYNSRRTQMIFDLMALDMDEDGELSIPEMAKAVRQLKAQ